MYVCIDVYVYVYCIFNYTCAFTCTYVYNVHSVCVCDTMLGCINII